MEPQGLTRVVETGRGGVLFPVRILTDLVVALARNGVRFYAGSRFMKVDPDAGRLVTEAGCALTGEIAAASVAGEIAPAEATRWAAGLMTETVRAEGGIKPA